MNHNFTHLPINEYPFIWSDFIELYTLTTTDGYCDERRFLELIQNDAIGKKIYSIDNIKALWQQVLAHAQERMALYDGDYPYEVNPDQGIIRLKFVQTHPKQRLYLSMVIANSINYLSKDWHADIAEDFATTCRQIFTCLMPEGTNLEPITNKSKAPLTATQIQNLIHLACGNSNEGQDPHLYLPETSAQASFATNENDIPSRLDLLAWHPIGNGNDGIPIAVAQFNCDMNDWQQEQKNLQALNEQAYTQHVPWATYHFSPIDLYTAKRDWKVPHLQKRIILLDRYRILTLAEKFFIYNDVPDIDHIEMLYQQNAGA